MKKTTQITTTLIKVGVVAFLCTILMFAIAWYPVFHKVTHLCDYYPQLLADCIDE